MTRAFPPSSATGLLASSDAALLEMIMGNVLASSFIVLDILANVVGSDSQDDGVVGFFEYADKLPASLLVGSNEYVLERRT